MDNTYKEIDISFVVVMYNADWESLKKTLDSIVSQKNITSEIVIADDGSSENHNHNLTNYFRNVGFENYTLVLNTDNHGTVENLYSGLRVCRGEYVKVISPKDYLYGQYTMRNWIDYLKEAGQDWSFSDAIYYHEVDGAIVPIECNAHPCSVDSYAKKNYKKSRWNYFVLSDIALGAAMLCKTSVQKFYCKQLLGKVKYAEDNVWRLMMFDGVVGTHYPKDTMLYEYGSGISTSANDIWNTRLMNDWLGADSIIFEKEKHSLDLFQINMIRAYKQLNNPIMKIFVKGKILSVLKRKFYPRKTNMLLKGS